MTPSVMESMQIRYTLMKGSKYDGGWNGREQNSACLHSLQQAVHFLLIIHRRGVGMDVNFQMTMSKKLIKTPGIRMAHNLFNVKSYNLYSIV